MNTLTGKITSIKSNEHMSIIDMETSGGMIKTVIIETPRTASFLRIGSPVSIMFKESEVSIAKNFSGMISLQNKLSCNIKEIIKGSLLSRIVLNCMGNIISSVITTAAVEQLDLKENDEVTALVKTNEIIIAPL